MTFPTLADFLFRARQDLARGPIAVILAEDDTEVESTIAHHLGQGFARLLLLRPAGILPGSATEDPRVSDIVLDFAPRNAVPEALSRIISAAAQDTWLYWGFNAEYLYYPYCESRSVGEMLAFHAEERRAAMIGYLIDLYAADIASHPAGVDRDSAMFERSGYYASDRHRDGIALERQFEIFGGLRWRFEEHIPWARRRLDRVALLRTAKGLTMRPDYTLSDEEMNTISCPWHHNLTCAVASFRTAKALLSNPGSRQAITQLKWSGSEPFRWSSQQLLEMGFIEPGQWF